MAGTVLLFLVDAVAQTIAQLGDGLPMSTGGERKGKHI